MRRLRKRLVAWLWPEIRARLLAGDAFAVGGPVRPSRAYLVGEGKSDSFVPLDIAGDKFSLPRSSGL